MNELITSGSPGLTGVSERAIVFGQQNSLVGIVAHASGSTPEIDRPAIVILNTGIIHRVGHNRMYVALSRKIALAGYVALRFDLSGIGDSDSRTEGLTPLESSLRDIREAIDWLATARRASQIILVGLCSGADQAVVYGPTDPRVVGLVLIDPSIPPTLKYFLKRVGPRLLRLRSWHSVGTGQSRVLRLLRDRVASAFVSKSHPGPWSLQNPKVRSYLEKTYRALVESGVEILAIFTGGEGSVRHNYREQLIDAFPDVQFGKKLQLEYFADCNHTFKFEADRIRLTRVVMEWMDKLHCGAIRQKLES
jgi:Serine aminopeptidase, S33